jgi:hypothetical protein
MFRRNWKRAMEIIIAEELQNIITYLLNNKKSYPRGLNSHCHENLKSHLYKATLFYTFEKTSMYFVTMGSWVTCGLVQFIELPT